MNTEKPKAWIGIDPGISGATVMISEDGIDFFDWPGGPAQFSDEITNWQKDYNLSAIIEAVHSMPKQGVASMFKFGCNFGIIQGVLSSLKIPYDLLSPQAWQKGLISKGDGETAKERSINVARRLYPNADFLGRKKDNGRADALLMAHVCRNRF